MSKKMEDRARQLCSKLATRFGDGALMLMSDRPTEDGTALSTGSLGLDRALGIGGLPRGRVVEIYGPEASGKTTLTLNLAAKAQEGGGLVAFIDAEHALDTAYAEALGVDVDRLLLAQPDSGEQALDMVEELLRQTGVELIIVDSVAALVPRAEIEGEMGDVQVGAQARLMSRALRKLTSVAHKQGTALVFVNQTRMKIGQTFGNPETTPGGKALKFFASVRLNIRRIGGVKVGDTVVGNHVRVKVAKNKVAPPHRQAEFDIVFGHGIDQVGEVLDLALQFGLAKKAGAWFSSGDQRLGQGRAAAIVAIESDPQLLEELTEGVKLAWARADQDAADKRKALATSLADRALKARASAASTAAAAA